MLLTEAFPIRGQAPQIEAYFDGESDTVMPTVNEARSFPTVQMVSEVQSKCGVRGRTELYERELTKNGNENPKEGGQQAPEEEKNGLSQLLGSSHRRRRERGGGG